MSTLTKVFIVLTTVLSIALSSLFVAAAAQWENWRNLAQELQASRDATIIEKQAVVASMEAALALKDETLMTRAAELRAAGDKLAEKDKQYAELAATLAQEKNEKLAAEAGRTKLQEILNVSTAQVKGLEKQNQTLVAQNMDLQSRNSYLNSRVLELTTEVTILTENVRNMQEKLFAAESGSRSPQGIGTIRGTVSADAPGAQQVEPRVGGLIRGRVMAADAGYASIDVGESAGVGTGMTFLVYREGTGYLGDLVIESVRPNEAGGKLTTSGQSVRRGDLVVLSDQG